jgi:hypothetical protein
MSLRFDFQTKSDPLGSKNRPKKIHQKIDPRGTRAKVSSKMDLGFSKRIKLG